MPILGNLIGWERRIVSVKDVAVLRKGLPLKVLLLSNKGPKCGVSAIGVQLNQALLGLGHDVTLYNADYPSYGPSNMGEYDVIHINFFPSTLGHIQAQHLPQGPLLSAFFHEIDPNWGARPAPDLWDRLELKFSSEPTKGAIFWQLPVPDYQPMPNIWDIGGVETINRFGVLPERLEEPKVRIGHTGIRGEALDTLEPICEKLGYVLSKSQKWINLEDEIERLASCHLVVCHVHSGYAGQSSAAMTAIASRRPVLMNSNPMTQYIRAADKALANELYTIENMEEGIELILEDIAQGREKRPFKLAEEFSFTRQANVLVSHWRERLK